MTDEAHQPTPQPAGDLGTASSQARVQFVGTGPGDPNLLTLGAVDAINRAQVIVISCAEHRMLLGSDFLGLRPDVRIVLAGATAVSGSGPAYVFLVAEAMIDAAVALGVPRDQASQLTVATLAGSAELLAGGEHPAVLRSKVTSPGGTTAAAVAALEAGGVRSVFADAMTACRDRAAGLS